MKQRIVTGTVFTLAVLAFLIPGFFQPLLLCFAMSSIALVGAVELMNAVRERDLTPGRPVPYLCMAITLVPVVFSFFAESLLSVFAVFSVTILFLSVLSVILVVVFHKKDGAFPDGIAAAAILLYISFPISCANFLLLFVRNGWYFFVLGLFSPWISDVFAYFTGVFCGRHKIVPRISPKKTWEGCIGGAISCSLLTMLYFDLAVMPLFPELKNDAVVFAFSAGLGLLLSVVSQLGDWLASSVKRWAGIKDFGKILPGHGGILDRFDSALFTLPVTFAITLLFFLEGRI